jgi:hypothetical protein
VSVVVGRLGAGSVPFVAVGVRRLDGAGERVRRLVDQLVNLAVALAQLADRDRGELDVGLPRQNRSEALDLEDDRRADVARLKHRRNCGDRRHAAD